MVVGDTVLPYELNTVLFADHAVKHRHIHLPEGEPMRLVARHGTLDFPVGTVISKTFAYPVDARDPSLGERLVGDAAGDPRTRWLDRLLLRLGRVADRRRARGRRCEHRHLVDRRRRSLHEQPTRFRTSTSA